MSLGSMVDSIFGGGSSAPTQTTSTTNTTNIPQYAQGYVENMLGATQNQLFNTTQNPDGTTSITGFKPYEAYGGTYDAQGNQLSYDPSKAVAGFSPMQQTAQQGIAGLQTPDQYNQAIGASNYGTMNAFSMGQNATPQDFQNQIGGYMNPYVQQALAPQLDELRRQYGISGTQQAAQATQAGAFGGSRDAIMAAENQRNLGTAQNQAIGNAYNNAFNAAQNQYNQSGAFQLQANQAGMQNANQLANLGQQQLTSQEGIYGLQNQTGAQQQAQQQAIINQSMTDYANAQQYPLMQLGTMSNMLRGLPMQASTTNQYAAAPSALSQGIGAAGAYAGLAKAGVIGGASGGLPKEFKFASGGIASIPSYNVGGEVEHDLENMTPQQIQEELQKTTSPSIKGIAQRILAEKQAEQNIGHAKGGVLRYAEPNSSNNNGITTVLPSRDSSNEDEMNLARSIVERNEAAGTTGPTVGSRTASGVLMRRPVIEDEGDRGAMTPEQLAYDKEVQTKVVPSDKGITSVPAKVVPAATTGTPAAATGNPAGGILGNATSGQMANAAPRVTPNSVLTPAMAATQNRMIDQQAALDKEANRTIEERVSEKEKILGPNTARDEYRAEEMARRANLKDEAERQKGMRLAEFFASWGSTPGSTLVAGMSALKKSIPGMVEDSKEAKRLEREADKIIYDLDQATRLEKNGLIKESIAEKNDLAKRAEEMNRSIVAAQNAEMTAKVSLEHARQSGESNKIARQGQADTKKYGQFQAAQEIERKGLEGIEREKNGKLYMSQVAELGRLSQMDEPSEAQKARMSALEGSIKKAEDDWKRRADSLASGVVNAAKHYAGEGADVTPPAAATRRDPSTFTSEEKSAYDWATNPANAKDPRAAQIKKRLGV
jgi:hypothetical protein